MAEESAVLVDPPRKRCRLTIGGNGPKLRLSDRRGRLPAIYLFTRAYR